MALEVSKVICFRCRSSACICAAVQKRALLMRQVFLAIAWVGGACLAGTVLGAMLAILVGS